MSYAVLLSIEDDYCLYHAALANKYVNIIMRINKKKDCREESRRMENRSANLQLNESIVRLNKGNGGKKRQRVAVTWCERFRDGVLGIERYRDTTGVYICVYA